MPGDDTTTILLDSGRLKVEIARPGTAYERTRFDWTGFITQITLDGAHTFCQPEDLDPVKGTGGIGLCGEFGIEKAIGYAEAQPGEAFPKLGIGLIKRLDGEAYRFFLPHELVERFPIEIETGADFARFTLAPIECRGYAVRQTKTIRVRENWLEIAYRLENVGSKAIHTHEYCHNFLGIDNQPVGPDYLLRFAFPVRLEDISGMLREHLPPLLAKLTPRFILERVARRMLGPDVLAVDGREVRWTHIPETKAFFCRPLGFFQTDAPQWELTHLPSRVTVREYDDFAPARVALWGQKHVVSPEVYIDVDVEPGASQSWTRKYEFCA